MKELQDILSSYDSFQHTGSKTALVTIMKTQGSTPRRPGARMLIMDTGTTIGTVSGGCLEANIAEKCKQVFASGMPLTVVYDMSSGDSASWGLHQECHGVVYLLLELLGEKNPHLDFLSACMKQQEAGVLATVFRVDGEFKAYVGTRVLLSEKGSVQENIRNPVLSAVVLEDCRRALTEQTSCVKEYRFTEGVVEAFIEVLQPPP